MHVNATCSIRELGSAFHRKSPRRALAGPAPETRVRWPTNEGSARFHRRSKTRLDPFALRSSRVLQGRMRFYDFCRVCFNEHGQGLHEHPRSTIGMLGRLPFPIHRYLWIEGNHRSYARSGAEDHRIPAFPFRIAPERDFAPTSIASDSSCRNAHSSALCGDT